MEKIDDIHNLANFSKLNLDEKDLDYLLPFLTSLDKKIIEITNDFNFVDFSDGNFFNLSRFIFEPISLKELKTIYNNLELSNYEDELFDTLKKNGNFDIKNRLFFLKK